MLGVASRLVAAEVPGPGPLRLRVSVALAVGNLLAAFLNRVLLPVQLLGTAVAVVLKHVVVHTCQHRTMRKFSIRVYPHTLVKYMGSNF